MGLAIITGAQRGMGKAIALALAEAGYDVAAVDLQNSPQLDDVAHELLIPTFPEGVVPMADFFLADGYERA